MAVGRIRVTIQPKIVYLADRRAGLTDRAFAEAWAEHGRLAMGLPIWRNMVRYAQCDPLALAGLAKPCDAIGLVWYRSLDAMAAIAREPALRQPLLDDELRTFSCPVREVAMLTHERVLLAGPPGGLKLFVFDPSEHPSLGVAQGPGLRAASASRLLRDDYTSTSRLPYRSVLECWYEDEASLQAAVAGHRDVLRGEGRLAACAFERPLYGYGQGAVRPT